MSTRNRPEVNFEPSGKKVPAAPDKTLLELSELAGVGIEAACGGKGTCGTCRVRIEGDATPVDPDERKALGPFADKGFRLACRTRPLQGLTVFVPEESLRHKQVILTGIQQMEIIVDSAVRARGLVFEGDGPILGLAVDLGTTTIVAYLYDLVSGEPLWVEGDKNPQIPHGDNLISRLSYALENKSAELELSRLLRECINHLAHKVCRKAKVSPKRIFQCVLVGNTVMHHMFLGLDLTGLSRAPFRPTEIQARETPAKELGLLLAPEAFVTTLPVKSGFVGADAVAAALALGADRVGEPTLIADLGTNGELVLATAESVLCCSTAVGPAFEGGHITHGIRAVPGAIEKVEIGGSPLKPTLSVIGGLKPIGICGSGLVSAVRALVMHGVIRPDGRFREGAMEPWLRNGPDGMEFVLATAEQSGTGNDLVLSRRDISELQLAKAAVYAGIVVMMEELGLKELSKVDLAGAFGNYINPADACGIGLFPGVKKDRVRGVGNAAGAGASMALLSRDAARRAEEIAEKMSYVELAGNARFNATFARGLSFPPQ